MPRTLPASLCLRPPAVDLAKRKDTAFGIAFTVADKHGDHIDDIVVGGGLYDCDPRVPGPTHGFFWAVQGPVVPTVTLTALILVFAALAAWSALVTHSYPATLARATVARAIGR